MSVSANCTLRNNATALDKCCPAGNLTVISNSTEAYCLLANQTTFVNCLSQQGYVDVTMTCGTLSTTASGAFPVRHASKGAALILGLLLGALSFPFSSLWFSS